jgi:hypothetical protein
MKKKNEGATAMKKKNEERGLDGHKKFGRTSSDPRSQELRLYRTQAPDSANLYTHDGLAPSGYSNTNGNGRCCTPVVPAAAAAAAAAAPP